MGNNRLIAYWFKRLSAIVTTFLFFGFVDAANLTGVVRDQSGNPISGASVSLYKVIPNGISQIGSQIRVNETGAFAWSASNGQYLIRASFYNTDVDLIGEPQNAAYFTPDFTVSGDTIRDIVFDFVVLTGRTLDQNGQPVGGVVVSTYKSWSGSEQGAQGHKSLRSVTHQNGNAVSNIDGEFTLLLYSTDDCVNSGYFADPDDCLYDVHFTPANNSGYLSATQSDIAVLVKTELTVQLVYQDGFAPIITAPPIVHSITDRQAVVEWQTDEPSTSVVRVVGFDTFSDSRLTRSHSVVINGLLGNTDYTVTVTSADQENNLSGSAQSSFTTLSSADLTPPAITHPLAISAIGSSTYRVSFCANEPVIGTLYRSDGDDLQAQVFTTPSLCHQIAVAGLQANTDYAVWVAISDTSGNGPAESSIRQVRTLSDDDQQAPLILGGPIVSAISDNSAMVSWLTDEPASSDLSFHNGSVYRVLSDPQLETTHRMVLSGLTPGSEYYLTASSTDGFGNGPSLSSTVRFTTHDEADTTAPLILGRPMAESVSEQSAIIRWSTDESASALVRFGLNAETLSQTVNETKPSLYHAISVVGLAADTRFYFQVESQDLSGNRVLSDVYSLQTLSAGSRNYPEIEQGPTVERLTSNTVTVFWRTNVNADRRLLCENASFIGEVSDSTWLQTHRQTLTGLQPETTYRCIVYSQDLRGFILNSTFSITTLSGDDTTAPSCNVVSVDAFGEQAELTWNADEQVSANLLYRVKDSTNWQSIGDLRSTESGQLLMTQLKPNTDYQHQLTVTDLSGNTAGCLAGEFNTGDLPVPPVNLLSGPIVLDIRHDSARIHWTTERLSTAEVRFGLSSGSHSATRSDGQLKTHFNVDLDGLVPETTYWLIVEAFNSTGQSLVSNEVFFTTLPLSAAPQILSGPRIEDSNNQTTVISWETDIPSTSVVELPDGSTLVDETPTTQHQVVVTGGSGQTVQVSSENGQGTSSTAVPVAIPSAGSPDSVLPFFTTGPTYHSIDYNRFSVSFCANEPVNGEVIIDGVAFPFSDQKSCHQIDITGLQPNTRYQGICRISDLANNGPVDSESVSVTTLPLVDAKGPILSNGPRVIDIADRSAVVIWTTDEMADSGVNYQSLDQTQSDFFFDQSLVLQHRILMPNLTPDTRYQLTVRSNDAFGNGSTESHVVEFTTLGSPDEKAPLILSGPIVDDVTDTYARVVWQTNESASSRVIYGLSAETLDQSAENGCVCTLDHQIPLHGLTADSDYFAQVISTDLAGNTVTSEIVSFRTGVSGPAALMITAGPTLTAISDSQSTFFWQTNFSTNARVQCEGAGVTLEVSDPAFGKNHRVTLKGLSAATIYQCQVFSKDPLGRLVIASTGFTSATTPDRTAPECTSEPIIVAAGNRVDVFWQTDEPSSAVVNYRSQADDSWLSAGTTELRSEASISLTGLSPETEYALNIDVKDGSGNRGLCYSGSFNSGTAGNLAIPQFSVRPYVSDIGESSVRLSWETDLPASGRVDFGFDRDALTQSAAAPQLSLSHQLQLTGLKPNSEYWVRVEAFNAAGDARLSDIISFTTLHPNLDFDLDGVLNPQDNCPLHPNADQLDADSDGLGDVCDASNDSQILPDLGAKITGKVTAEGVGIGNAVVSLFDRDKNYMRSEITVADGSYGFKALPSGRYYINVSPPNGSGFSATPLYPLQLEDRDRVHWISLIGNALTLSGYLKDSADRVLDNVQVSLHRQDSGNQVGERVTTDSQGYFEFPVAPDTYQLRAVIDVFGPGNSVPAYPVPDFATVIHYPQNIVMTDHQTLQVNLPLAQLSGQVIDANSDPVAGVAFAIRHQLSQSGQIFALESYGNDPASRAISDANGNITMALFTDQPIDMILIPPPDRADLAATRVAGFQLNADHHQVFSLSAGMTLSGHLKDTGGRAIDRTRLTLHDQTTSAQVGRDFYTDDNGFYSVQVESGQYKIQAHLNPFGDLIHNPTYPLPDFATSIYAEQDIIVSGVTSQDVILPMAQLSALVLDTSGNPVANTRLSISHIAEQGDVSYFLESNGQSLVTHAKTDNVGRMTVALFTGQSMDITLVPPLEQRELASTKFAGYSINGDHADTFVLTESVVISGYLRDADGVVIDNTELSIFDASSRLAADVSVITNSDGYYQFKVAPGDYNIRPTLRHEVLTDSGNFVPAYPAPDFAAIYHWPRHVHVTSDLDLDIDLPLSVLSGKTLDMNGVPVGDVRLQIDHAFTGNAINYYLQNSGEAVNSHARSLDNGDFGFALFHQQDTDISINPPTGSGFAITNITHRIAQPTSETLYLPHTDTPPKIIAGPHVTTLTESSAVVVWTTDKPAKGLLEMSDGQTIESERLTTQKQVLVQNLETETHYQLTVQAIDKNNQVSDQKGTDFTTLAVPTTKAPEFVSGPTVNQLTSTGFFVDFCADSAVIGELALTYSDGDVHYIPFEDFDVCHKIEVENLAPGTSCSFTIDIVDPLGNGPTSSTPHTVSTLTIADRLPPAITLHPMVIDITATEATVIWSTDEPSNSGVSYNNRTQYHVVTDPQMVQQHSLSLTDLTPETTYWLTVSSTDAQGNGPTLSETIHFTTLSLPDTEPPCIIGDVQIQNITHQNAVIRWRTCERASSVVMIGTAEDQLDRIETHGGLHAFHNIAVTRLEPDTHYYFKVQSVDAAGNAYTSELQQFRTKVRGHQGVPYFMQNVTIVDVSDTHLSVHWETDVNADGRLACVGDQQTLQVSHSQRTKDHALTLGGLSPATAYQCTVYSTDNKGYTASEPVTFNSLKRLASRWKATSKKVLIAHIRAQASVIMTEQVADNTAPAVTIAPQVFGYGDRALITLATDELSSLQVFYRPVGTSVWQSSGEQIAQQTHHAILTGLSENIEYQGYYRLSDLSGNYADSGVLSFNSGLPSDLAPPVFATEPVVTDITNYSAVISWTTDEIAYTQVSYGTSPNELWEKEANSKLVRSNRVALVRLGAATAYVAKVTAYNLAGVAIDSALIHFVTATDSSVADSDGDGINDEWELANGLDPNDPLDAESDLDNDGLTNFEEYLNGTDPHLSDTDNDGIPDGWEVDHGLDPTDGADANEDRDQDGTSNLQEYMSAGDTIAPAITLETAVTLNATGYLTPVPSDGVSASDNIDGAIGVTLRGRTNLPSGQHRVYWQAVDNAGNRTIAQQTVNIVPRVLLSRGQSTAEGNRVVVDIRLSGSAAAYPVIIPFTLSGTADSSDYRLFSSSVRIEQGTQATIEVEILEDGQTEPDETLIIDFASPTNAVLDQVASHVVTISERNLAPQVRLSALQNGSPVTTVTRADGLVVLTALVTDANLSDTHHYDWSSSDNTISDLDLNADRVSFDPASMAEGVYRVGVNVTDSGLPTASRYASLIIKVIASAPALSANEDSDGDGINDHQEGWQDSDGDGVADYLDGTDDGSLLAEIVGDEQGFWMQTEAGLSLQLGRVSRHDAAAGTLVDQSLINDISPYNDHGVDQGYDNNGGLFDFVIAGLEPIGSSVQLVIPQLEAIPANAEYRKLDPQNGWQSFISDNNNRLYSAPGVRGACPVPGSDLYTQGMTEGHWCLMMLIEDGGANDTDGLANGEIHDPGGVSSLLPLPTVTIPAIASIIEGQSIQLSATVNDNGNVIESYFWQQVAGPSVSVVNADSLNASVSIAPMGTLTFQLAVTDLLGRTVTASVNVIVNKAATNTDPSASSEGSGGGTLPLWMLLLLAVGGGKRASKN